MDALHYLKECLSTNDEIESFLLHPSENITGVYTFNQTQGRGQYGNQWKISPNLNIAFSVAINSAQIHLRDSFFNYYTANSIRDFLANLTDNEVKTKWPNDLILGNKKIGGILIEKRKVHGEWYYIIGLGLNVLQESFPEVTNAGSLLTQTGQEFDLHTITEKLFNFLYQRFTTIPSETEILEQYNRHLYRKNVISVFEKGGEKQNGIIQKADENGDLWIDLEDDGLQKFYHKEIKLLY